MPKEHVGLMLDLTRECREKSGVEEFGRIVKESVGEEGAKAVEEILRQVDPSSSC